MAEGLPFSALSSSLACSFSPLAFSGRIMHWESDFFSLVFFHFGCENVSFLDGRRRKKRQKDRKSANRKVTKVSSDTQGEVGPSQDSSHTLTHFLNKHNETHRMNGKQEGHTVYHPEH